ncbi:MAG: SDR family oxidoreductase [Pseudomonadota bacterium]
MSSLDRKRILVTGAANGIGAAAARRIADEGGFVVALDLDGGGLEKIRVELGDRRVVTVTGSADDEDVLDAAVSAGLDRFGGLNGAVFCAGSFGVSAPLHEYPIDVYDRVMRLNVRGPFVALQKLVPHLEQTGGGSIVFVSSINGVKGFPTFGAYAASKQAVTGLMKTAAIDLAARKIRVNSVHPGVIDTQMMRDVEQTLSPDDTEGARTSFASAAAMKRYGETDEIAASIAFLLSDDASYVTGATQIVDGGFTAGVIGA